MADQWMALAQFGELAAKAATDADPVFRRAFEEVECAGIGVLQRTQLGPPQAESGSAISEWKALHGS